MTDTQYLEHIGVLGMKWGRRKRVPNRDLKGSERARRKLENSSDEHNRKVTLKKKRINEMTNDELKELNNRLQLERQYKDLKKSDVSAGQKFATDLLVNSAKQTAANYVAKGMTKGVEALIKKGSK